MCVRVEVRLPWTLYWCWFEKCFIGNTKCYKVESKNGNGCGRQQPTSYCLKSWVIFCPCKLTVWSFNILNAFILFPWLIELIMWKKSS